MTRKRDYIAERVIIEKIRQIWFEMTKKNRVEALKIIRIEFGLDYKTNIKVNWIYQRRIPLEYQNRTLEIFNEVK